ncbi:MAG: BamA/TamA family outer membrane protein [Gammaproteobacteria bacterium]|nr:BamA/TamA family outer membrane protein [Gammaproteobacteria bacterium]
MLEFSEKITVWLACTVTGLAVQLGINPAVAEDGIAASAVGAVAQPRHEPESFSPDYFEQIDATIGAITIDNRNVFDLQNPEEDRWLYRLANNIHRPTRTNVIRSQLLITPGSKFSLQKVDESERILRKNRYIREAEIEIDKVDGDVVDLTVRTTDVWTLKADLSFGRKGGVNTGGFGIEENNVLGTGTHIGTFFKRTVDRDVASLNFANKHFRGTRYTLAGTIARNSDGFDQRLALFKPFFSMDSRRAGGFTLHRQDRVDTLYALGRPQAAFRHELSQHEVFRGWSGGLRSGWSRRYVAGLAYEEHRFAIAESPVFASYATVPRDRRFVYPFVGLQVLEDRFEKTRNFDHIHRTEDRFLGTRYGIRVGYAPANRVSPSGTLLFRGEYRTGYKFAEAETLITGVEAAGRLAGDVLENSLLTGFATYHRRQSKNRLLYASLRASVGHNLDLDNPQYLGGASGLRGFPLRYQSGTGKAILTIEQRFFTDWYPFRLIRVGGAVFFDAGRTWGETVAGGPGAGLMKNVGFGLRLANTRSSQGRILHIDVAYPLDKLPGVSGVSGVQILLEAKQSF